MLNFHRKGHGSTLVLLHGFLGGCGYWQRQLQEWSAVFDVIAVDLPGFAGSANEVPCSSIGEMAQRVLCTLDALGVDDFQLVGHSMGGMVAQEIASREAGRVSKLVLYGTGSTGILPGRFETIDTSIARLHQDGVVTTANRIVATWFIDGDQAQAYSLCVHSGAGTTMEAAAAALEALRAWNGQPRLGELRMPVLVITGDSDRSCSPARAYDLWSSIESSRLCIVPRAAHAAHLEAPELFDLAVTGFLVA
jgi:pimeloyl-ACP methyl ester carboxylesterase